MRIAVALLLLAASYFPGSAFAADLSGVWEIDQAAWRQQVDRMVDAMLAKMPPEAAAQLKAQGVDPGATLRDGALDDIVGTVEFLPGGVVRSTTPKDGTREDAHWQLDGDDLQITVNDAKGMEGIVGRVEGDRITMKPVIANDNEDTAFLRQLEFPLVRRH
jgi:hypothetical protein